MVGVSCKLGLEFKGGLSRLSPLHANPNRNPNPNLYMPATYGAKHALMRILPLWILRVSGASQQYA